jgi:hypothetical protein
MSEVMYELETLIVVVPLRYAALTRRNEEFFAL